MRKDPKDFRGDELKTLNMYLVRGGKIPDYVRDGDIPDDEMLSKLSSDSFADPVERQYPLNSRAVAWVSALYAIANGDENAIPGVKRAAGIYRFENEIYEMEKILSQKIASRSDDEKSADTGDIIGGVMLDGFHQYMRKGTPEGVKAAVDDLEDPSFVDSVNSTNIRKIARDTISCARKLGMDEEIPDKVMRMAGYGVPDLDSVALSIQSRRIAYPAEAFGELVRLADGIKTATDVTPEDADRLVDILDKSDRDFGVVHLRGARFPDPYDSVFSICPNEARKLASENEYVELPGGIEITRKEASDPGFLGIASHVIPGCSGFDDLVSATDIQKAALSEILSTVET